MAQALDAAIHLFDYLAMDDASELRHEYVGGRIYAMTGGTMRHNRISGNVFRVLADRLEGSPCPVFIHDMKLHIQAADSVYYPDGFVHCRSALASGDKVVQDATLIVEVMSESTVEIDRREKLVVYQKLPGLRAYWIASQDTQRVEAHERDASGRWQAMAYNRDEVLPLTCIDREPVSLAILYAGTDVA
jgi:Uma2 family endonuclease